MDSEQQERVILVVDNSPMAPCAVRAALVPLGYRVSLAVDETDALDKLANETAISLVLVDMRTSSRNGFDVVQAIEEARLPDNSTTVPIVVLSAEGQPHRIEKAESAGRKAWRLRPFDLKAFGTGAISHNPQPKSTIVIL